MASNIDATKPTAGNATTSSVRDNFSAAKTEIEALQTQVGSDSLPTHIADTAAHGATGAVVGTTNTQTLTNKTLTSPDINGGTIDDAVIGGASAAAGTFTTGVFNTSLGVGGSPGVGGDLEVIGATSATLETRTSTGGRRIALLASDSSGALIGTRSNHALAIMTNNSQVAEFGTNGDFSMANAAGPALLNEAATSTNPTHVPNKADPDTGVGWVSADVGAAIAGGAEAFRWDASGNIQLQGSIKMDDGNVLLSRDSTSFRMVTNASLPIELRTVDAQPIIFKTTNTERMRIDANTGGTGGAGSAGAGNQYVELNINGSRYKLLHDGTI